MIKVTQHSVLIAKNSFALKADPLCPVSHYMNTALEPPARIPGTMRPTFSRRRKRWVCCGILEQLRKFRLEAKASMRAAEGVEKVSFDALQGAFKTLINSFYGYLGFAQGNFADFDAAVPR